MAKERITENIIIENARLIFKNFGGEASKYNRKGDRNFCVVIDDPEQAQGLANDGWNIKRLDPRDEDDEPTYYITVKVNFDNEPIPVINMVTSITKKKTQLFEDTVQCLDYSRILTADVIIKPYNWEVNGKTGVSAYLQTLYVMIEEDPFAYKYE